MTTGELGGRTMTEINGKEYPLWSQFVEKRNEWIGGILEDFEDYGGSVTTIITDITLKPNGEDSAFFCVEGKDFGCGFDVQHGGIGGRQKEGWLTFSGYGGHKWRIKKSLEGGH